MTTAEVVSGEARDRRRGWLLAMAGIAVGLLVRAATLVTGAQGAELATLQLGFVGASAVVLGGLLLAVRADRFVWTRGLTEAATLTTGALAMLMWVGLVQPYVARAAIDSTLRVVAELSLVVDLVLAVGLVCLFSRRPTRTRATLALSVGTAVHIITDVGFVVASAQRGGAISSAHLVALIAVYALGAFAVVRISEGEPKPTQHHAPAVFDPLVGVVLVNSVTVVLAGLHEDRLGALAIAAAALVLTAVAARAQWKLHAANESMLRAVDAQRQELREENMALMAAHAMASETLANTSHFLSEMTTRVAGPLNGVLEAADRLRDPEMDKSADNLLALVNELLGVSEDAALTPVLTEGTFSLRTEVVDALAPYAEAAAAKGVGFAIDVDDAVPEMVRSDAARLRELLGLFADNAVAYTKAGTVNVGVNFVEVRDDGRHVVYVELTDTGIGMSAYDCYRAFEFDVRAEPDQRRYRGKPRGLTQARVLVEQFDGLYGVESELGRGASFWFTLALCAVDQTREGAAVSVPELPSAPEPVAVAEPEPLVDAPELEPEPEPVTVGPEPEPVTVGPEPEPVTVGPEPESPPAAEIAPAPAQRQGLLLFAEDDPLCRRITVAALRRAGYDVDTVTNGVDAVNAIAQRAYDLVLMDLHLPVMTGLEAAAAIRSGGANAEVPIIAISAFTAQQQQQEAIAAGMNAFVKKPLDLDPLLDVLERWTRERALS